MSTPQNRRQGAAGGTRTRPQQSTITGPIQNGGSVRPASQMASSSGRRPAPSPLINVHRAIASLALVLLMALSLLAPLGRSAPNPATFLTPRIDGSGSALPGFAGEDWERALFPYLTDIEQSQGSDSGVWPDLSSVLSADPSSVRARKAIIGQIFASTSGNLNQKLRDTGLEANASLQRLEELEFAYIDLTSDTERQARGLNGVATLTLLRSLSAAGEERYNLERLALNGFQLAINNEAQRWELTYNLALANFAVGNYSATYDAMAAVTGSAAENNNLLPPFWMGLSALRNGDPGEAAQLFRTIIDTRTPTGGNEAFNRLYEEAREISREGLGDALWANRDPGAAYNTYFNSLQLGRPTAGLYGKWLRLGLSGHGYERLVADMGVLADSPNFSRDAHIHYDRARLLSLLGRGGEAMREYERALELGESAPALLIAHGQALASSGDYTGALVRAEEAIRKLGRDPGIADLSSVAAAADLTTTPLRDAEAGQQLLAANLLRARAWGAMGNGQAVSQLAEGIAQRAGELPTDQAGLLHLYAAFAYEASGAYGKADGSYNAAWERLRGLAPGAPGRAAALAGLARSQAGGAGAQAAQTGLDTLKANGYDPLAPPTSVANDPDAPPILYQGSLLLKQAGKPKEAANALRVASVADNLQDARKLLGVGRPLWVGNGTQVPAQNMLAAADAARSNPAGVGIGIEAMRYKLAYGLNPALAPAWNNLGVRYAELGNRDRAQFYLNAASTVSRGYAWGQHNLAALAYRGGLGNFFTAEAAQGAAVKGIGPESLRWGYNLRYDERGPVPSPAAPPSDFLSRLPALVILALLLAHTLIGRDRQAGRDGVVPARGILGGVGALIDSMFRGAAPALVRARPGMGALLLSVALPALVGMVALAWGASQGYLEVALVFLPAALLAALLALLVNEVAQRVAARSIGGATLHHTRPMGVLLGLLSIPFGFLYGWGAVTRVQPATGGDSIDRSGSRRLRSAEELDLDYEAQVEAAADTPPGAAEGVAPASAIVPTAGGWLGLSPAARILFAGLAANLALALLFGLGYWLTGWPSLRLMLFAQVLVLAFTSVSEPPADGWALYRRNAPLWLALFVMAAVLVTLLAVGLI